MSGHFEAVRYFNAGEIRFHNNEIGQPCATLADGTVHEHILVYRTFPITLPGRYISIRAGTALSSQKEIGMIRDLNALPVDQRRFLEDELAKRYFYHVIEKIEVLKEDFGYLLWICETDKGRREFNVNRWEQRKVYQAAGGCRVITDVHGNRYEIPDLDRLDAKSQALFHRFIYW